MRVIFNNLATLKPKTGVGHYAARLAHALNRQMPAGDFTLFPGPTLSSWIGSARNVNKGAPRSEGGLKPWLKDTAKQWGNSAISSLFRLQCHPGKFDLYHEPNFLPLSSRLPTVVTVHDLSVLLHPEWHPADRVRRHEAQFRQAADAAAHIITVSEVVRDEVIQILGLPAHRVTAVPNGVGPEYFAVTPDAAQVVRRRHALPDQFLLYVGTLEPRKNLLTLMRAYCDLPSEVRARCPLVLAGGWGWQAGPIAEFLKSNGEPCGVRHLGYIPDSDLPGLYAAARALVFPSHYEGFGLPPLEMLATGGAVIASTAAAHREVLGDRAAFVAPEDLEGWRNAIEAAIVDNDWLSGLRHGASEHAAKFTWDYTAQETVSAYQKVHGKRLAA